MIMACVGMGFGDEGKGKVVSSLCSQFSNPLVVRYSGGQQAGHRVVLPDGRKHIFANFGSGTLQGFHTYWSKYCTVDPIGIMNELMALQMIGIRPRLYIDNKCPITTPYEKCQNKHLEKQNYHGTCGVGVGETYQREEDHYSLLVSDLLYPSVLRMKLNLIRERCHKIIDGILTDYVSTLIIDEFIENCQSLVMDSCIRFVDQMPCYGALLNGLQHLSNYDACIFEGSQGLLLDEDIGFFPHVTRGHTGTKNIVDMKFEPEIYLVTRAYQTRHGYGPMTNDDKGLYFVNPHEHNSNTGIQGQFRSSILDLDLLLYAMDRDEYISNATKKNLVITCLDVVIDHYAFTLGGKVLDFKTEKEFITNICQYLCVDKCFVSRNPNTETLKQVRVT